MNKLRLQIDPGQPGVSAMRLTKQTNYAIGMLMFCAAREAGLSRVQDVAKAYAGSELFLFKILQPLAAAGIMETVRSRNGSIRRARPADEITLLDVVKVTEDSFAMAECFDDSEAECTLVNACALNSALREALNAFFEVLSRHTIRSLADARTDIYALLGLSKNAPETV